MALDELVVSIRYEADLRSFKDSIAIAERQTGAAVARMTQVLGSLHEPFAALFDQLSELQQAADSFKLPDDRIQVLSTLTQEIAGASEALKKNLEGIRSPLTSLARDIEGVLTPLSDPQLEKNLEALGTLFGGDSGSGSGGGLADRFRDAGLGISTVAAFFMTKGRVRPRRSDLIAGGAAGSQLEPVAGFIEDLFSSEEGGNAAAGSLLDRFDRIVSQVEAWAAAQQRIAEALEPSVSAYKQIEESLTNIASRVEALPTLRLGGVGTDAENMPPRALGGPVYPGVAFLVGERGPEIFVPDRAGRILPNNVLAGGGSGGGLLGDDFDAVIMEIERFGQALDLALGDMPEEVRKIAEAVGGSFIGSLEQGRGVMEAMQRAGREAAKQLLHTLLQSEAVRGELGELADVIENVLNQALNGSIDSWEDLGRVALEVLQAIAEKMVEAQGAAAQGSGNGGGFLGTILQLAGAAFGAFAGGGSTVGGAFGAGNTTGAGGAGFSYLGYGGPRARGGPVMPNRAFLVGEMGPELFMPKVPGNVIPNGALGGGGVTLNVTIYAPGADPEGLEKVRGEVRGLYARVEQLNRSVEPRAVAEVMRQADRGGSFARSVGRRPS